MADPPRHLPSVSECTSYVVGRKDALRRVTIHQTSTSLPNISKSCTSKKRRPTNLFQPARVVARRYKSAVLKWLTVNRRKNMRGKEPWPASWPILGWHNKIRFVHFVQPLPVSTGRPAAVTEKKKKKKTTKKSFTPCLQHRAARMGGKALNPFVRIGGGYRQGYIIDPGYRPQVEEKGKDEVSVKAPDHQSVNCAETASMEVGLAKTEDFTADYDLNTAGYNLNTADLNHNFTRDDTLGVIRVSSSKQSKRKKKKKWARNKAGERALVVCEGTDLSGVEEVDDERQLGISNIVRESQEDSSSSSSDDSDAKLSQDGSVNADSDGSDHQREKYYSNKQKRTQSHKFKDDEEGVSHMSIGRRKRSVTGVEGHGSIGESSGDARAGYGKRKKRGRNRLTSNKKPYNGEDVEDDDDKGERRGSPKRRRRKIRHGEKVSIQSSHTGASGDNASDLDDQADDVSDGEKSPSLDDDASVQTSRKPSIGSIGTEDGNEDGGGRPLKHEKRDKQKHPSVTDVLANETYSEKTVHNRQRNQPTGYEQHQTNHHIKKKERITHGSVTKKRSYSANSSKRSDSEQGGPDQLSVSDSEPSVFSKGTGASSGSQLQPGDPRSHPGYSQKQSERTSKSSISHGSESNACAGSVGSVEVAGKVIDAVSSTGRKSSHNHNRKLDVSCGGSDSIRSGHESSLSPALQPRVPSPDTTQLSVTATAPSVVPSPSGDFLEPVSAPRKSEIKRRRSFHKGQEERGGLTVEQNSSDSDEENVLEERKKERRRRLSKKHSVPPDPPKGTEAEEQKDQPNEQCSSANVPYTPSGGRRKSQPGRDSRSSRSSQPRSTPATMETAETMSIRSGLSARQRRVGVDCSSYLPIRSTVLDTVPSSEDVRSSPLGSVISSDISGVQARTAECLEGLTGGTLSHVFSSHHHLENDIGVPSTTILPSELVLDEEQHVAVVTVRTSPVKPPMHRDSGEGDVDDDDDDDEDDDDDIMPQDSQSSASGTCKYQRSVPSVISQNVRKEPPHAEGTPASGSEPAAGEEELYTSPQQYCRAIDTDSGGRSTSNSPSVFGNETDIRSSIIASHAGRRFSGSVSTVVSHRGPKKWQKGGFHQRNFRDPQPTVLPIASEMTFGPGFVHPTPYRNLVSEDSAETYDEYQDGEKESRSPSPSSCESAQESEMPTPADRINASSVSSADRHESSSGSSSELDGPNWRKKEGLSRVSHKLVTAIAGNNPDMLKNLLPASPSIAAMEDSTQTGTTGVQRDLSVGMGMSVSHHAFQNHTRHYSSSLSGSNNDLNSESGNSKSSEEQRNDGGHVESQSSEVTTEQGDVPEAEPLSRKPWEDLNKRGAQQRCKMQIQIRADEVLSVICRRARADSANAKRKNKNGAAIDFLAQYHLVDGVKLGGYARAFAAEDEDEDGIITFPQLMLTLETIRSTSNMSRAQLDYVFSVLDLEDAKITFQMFAVIVALCERISAVANETKDILDGLDMIAIEKKLKYYMRLFLGSEDDDEYDGNKKTVYSSSVKTSLLRIELKAGGLGSQMEDQVIRRCDPLGKGRVMFLDYVAYIPLFIYMHDKICDNPLSKEQFGPSDQPEAGSESEAPVDTKSKLESVSLPPIAMRHGSASSVASSLLGGTLLLKQARTLLARQASIVQSRIQMEQAQSVTSLVQDNGTTVQTFQLPPIVSSSTKKSPSKSSSKGLSDVVTKEDEAWRLKTPVVRGRQVRGDQDRSGLNRRHSSSSDSPIPVRTELRRGKKTSTSSIHSSLKLRGGATTTTAERIRRITQRVCESQDSDDVRSSIGDHDSRSTTPSLVSSNPPSRVSVRQANGNMKKTVIVDEATPVEQETVDLMYCHPPLGRLVVPPPVLPPAVRKLRTRSPAELSPTPFTSSSGRTSPSNSVYSSIQASLIQGTTT